MSTPRAILVHGGAWATPAREIEPHRQGVYRAALAGWEVLAAGGSAVDAVCAAVRAMEDDPAFNAGRGAVLNRDGEVELDAGIMRGLDLEAGAVGGIQGIEHPIDAARLVMERSPHVLLVGAGAVAFARSHGAATCEPAFHVVERERARWKEAQRQGETTPESTGGDTVGAVARDGDGHLAAANSTGGTLMKLPGRVGDSPLVGCGLYADDRVGAAVATGWGEGIIRVALARRTLELLGLGKAASEAAREAIGTLAARTGGKGGVIVVDASGRLGQAFNTAHMSHAYRTDGMTEPVVDV